MRRRDLLLSAAAAPALSCGSAPPPDRRAAEVKITGVEIFRLEVNRRGPWTILRLTTDAALTGLGEASHSGRDDPAVGKIEEYVEWMRGRSVYDVESLRARAWPDYAEFGRATSCAASAIEQAMFDIQGQIAGVPCHALFGGKLRDEVRCYANISRSTDERTPEGFAAMARSAVEAGFDAVKMASYDGLPRDGSAAKIEAHTELGTNCIRAVRDEIGSERDLLVDAHSNFDLARGLDLIRRLTPLNLFWLEEISRSYEELAKLREAAPMTTAGGESLFGVKENYEYLQYDTVDILMPDVKYCGGMLELKKIAALAEGASVRIAPHGPAGPIGNMAAAHVAATLPNFEILEYSHGDAPWRAELTDPPEPMNPGGMLRVLDRPGLGYRLNMKTVEARKLA